MYSNLHGRFPDELEYRPIFEAAAAMNLPILLHPALPVVADQVSGYDQISGLGNMFDTTISLNRLIMSGIFDLFPNLKLVCPHLGGTLPYLIGRIDHQNTILKRGPRLQRKPSEYLAQVWLDAVSPLPSAVRLAHEIVGPDRMLFASDHPWVEPVLIRDSVLAAKLPATSEAKLFCENSKILFNL
jgi:predicted TIM-barrel fold metal-dependent hydrolase